MLAPFAFCMQRRRAGLESGSGPPAFTAKAMSFPILENVLAILSQRANLDAFLYSNARPINIDFFQNTKITINFQNE